MDRRGREGKATAEYGATRAARESAGVYPEKSARRSLPRIKVAPRYDIVLGNVFVTGVFILFRRDKEG